MRLALCLMAAAFLTAAPARAGEVVEVKIVQLAYAPAKITAHVGDTVEWKNGDFVAHTEESHGTEAVERVLDSAHALMNHGVHRYTRPPKLNLEDENQWGVGKFEQFSWKSLLDTYACTECCDQDWREELESARYVQQQSQRRVANPRRQQLGDHRRDSGRTALANKDRAADVIGD